MMFDNVRLYSLSLPAPSLSHYIYQLQRLWSLLWRVSWLGLAWYIGILAIVADQFYSIGSRHNDVSKLELAAQLFPIERNIALGPSFYFMATNNATEQALAYINRGLEYDPYSVDLIESKIQYSLKLGKNEEAIRAFNRLALIVPNNNLVKRLSKKD